MTLGMPLPGGYVSQSFGPSGQSIQPAMYHVGTEKAYWLQFPGSRFNANVHAGTDFAGMSAGSYLVAAEAGTVVRSTYDSVNGGGNVVEVEIKSGVRYSYNHCQTRLVGLGAKVSKGQRIARVGATGTIWTGSGYVRSTYGVHCHAVLTISEKGSDGVTRTMLHDFADYMAGGYKQAYAIVKPTAVVTYPLVKVRYPVNIRSTPDLDVGSSNIAYVSRETGVYTYPGGARAGRVGTGFQLRGSVTNDDGTWGKLWGFNRYLYVMKGLYQ